MIPDRIMIVFVIAGGLGLLWLAWQYYKMSILKFVQVGDVTKGKPNLLYFTGQHCTACRFQQTPIIESVVSKLGDSVAVKKYDVTEHPDLASRYQILTLPTTIIVNEAGEVKHINRGVAPQHQLESQLLLTP